MRCISAALIAALLFPSLRCEAKSPEASPRSVAVVPLADGDGDEVSREIAAAVGDALRVATGHRVVAADVAERVLAYRGAASDDAAQVVRDAAAALARAKEHYFAFRYREAQAELAKVIAALAPRKGDPDAAPLAVDALLTKALIAKSRGTKDEARAALAEAFELHPGLALTSADYPPSFMALADEVRAQRASLPSGGLVVASNPAGAEVLVNGIPRGVAPLEISALPAGPYGLVVRAPHYRDERRTIEVAPGKRERVRLVLAWGDARRRGAAQAQADDAQAAVRVGLAAAEALKVDKAIVLDADEGREGTTVTARTIDRSVRAGLRPVVIPEVASDERHALLARLTAALADQIDADAMADPAGTLDPVGQGDPVLLTKRKQKLTRRPLFWAIVGTVAAGAIAGGIAASMGGGSDVGSVKVSFK